MNARPLTDEQEAMLRIIYRQDVIHWNWNMWLSTYRKLGEGPMGYSWVVLPYKPQDAMPAARERMNELYLEALQDHAAEHGLNVRFNDDRSRLVLYRAQD